MTSDQHAAYIRQLEFKLEKAEHGMGMPYSREDVAHYRRLLAEAREDQTMSTHTPGPWELDTNHGIAIYPCGARIRMPDTPTASNMARKMADARLIAAAPDLLDLARNVAGLDPAYVEKIDGPVLVVAAIREWIEQARAAIAKAEGTS